MLGAASPDNDSVPLGSFDFLTAVLVGPLLAGCEAEIRHRLTVLRVPELGVAAQVADHLAPGPAAGVRLRAERSLVSI